MSAPGEMLAFSLRCHQLAAALVCTLRPAESVHVHYSDEYIRILVLRHFRQPFMIVLIGVCFLAAWEPLGQK